MSRLSVITTSGDRIKDKPLRDFGGKGLFTKEIDEALLRGDGRSGRALDEGPADRSAAQGIVHRRRAAARRCARRLHQRQRRRRLRRFRPARWSAPRRLRRQAQVKRLRPDLRVIDFRGNVETRLAKLDRRQADATLLALAGLERLGLAAHATSILSTEEMLPAVAQGAIGVACRSDDAKTRELLAALNDAASATAVACERAFLARLDGSCKTPIAGLAEIADGASALSRADPQPRRQRVA